MRSDAAIALACLCMLAACGDDGSATPLPDSGAADAGAMDATVVERDATVPTDAGLVRSEGFAESTGDVANPDRGLYAWDWDTSVDLVLVKPHLGPYCDGATIPGSFLDALRTRLAAHRDAGRRVILRFVYADDGALNACGRADAESVEVIEGHLAQLAPFLAEHLDVIAFVEAGLLGMWGEWNSEHAPSGTELWTDPDVRRRVVLALLSAVPEDRAVLLRRPRFRQELETVLTPEQLARVGHHNDCLFASATDYGTYDGDRSVEEWKTYLESVTQTAPAGGETCVDDAAFTTCTNALPELERLGYTYVHKNYRAEVLDRWRAEGCFDEIARRLGYRIVLRAVEAPRSVAAGGSLPVVLELDNTGFAPPYVTRRISVVLRDEAGARTLATTSGADTRGWQPGETVRVSLEAHVPADLASGDYSLRVVLLDDHSDARAHALLFANDGDVPDETHRENVLGTITVR